MHRLIVLALPIAVAAALPARADTLRLSLPTGAAYAAALTQSVIRPFAASHHAMVRLTKGADWDVAQLDAASLADACAKHSIAPIDWGKIGGRERFLAPAQSACGVGAVLRGTVLTWTKTKLARTPGWPEFWDVARIPGKRALPRTPQTVLEIALMADGVAPSDVYAVLRGKGGVDRAFRKLDQLKPYLVWWTSDAEAMRIVASGQALMAAAPADQVLAATRKLNKDFGLQWAGGFVTARFWAIRAGSRPAQAALGLIDAASHPAAQTAILTRTGLGNTVPIDLKGLDPALAAADPAAHLDQALSIDAAFWRDQGAALTQRFDEWLKH